MGGALANRRGDRRQRQLDATVAAIRGRYGPWALVQGKPAVVGYPHIPTGFSELDRALGIGGLPRGRLCEWVGPATSGKTTLALKFLAQAQAGGREVGYVDQALYFDADYAHRCGLDLSRLLVGTPRDPQETLAVVEALVRSGGLAALVLETLEFLWDDATAASAFAASLARLAGDLPRSGTVLLVLHEPSACRSPALSALAHRAAVRLGISREQWLQRGKDVYGYEARVQVLKNQWAPAGRTVRIAIKFNGTVQGNGL